jgi:hypothetical protein
MRDRSPLSWLGLALCALWLSAGSAHAAKKPTAAPLVETHKYPGGAFTFQTPAGWKDGAVAGNPEALQSSDGQSILRFVYHPQEVGYDSLHAVCMLERLAGPMETQPQVFYEYDFVSWVAADRRVLDSAFEVSYDQPVQGSKSWRQRNLTMVGGGESLCIVSYVPIKEWRKSASLRATIDEIVKSVTFRAPAPAAPVPGAH